MRAPVGWVFPLGFHAPPETACCVLEEESVSPRVDTPSRRLLGIIREFISREPAKAVANAFGVGLLFNLLPGLATKGAFIALEILSSFVPLCSLSESPRLWSCAVRFRLSTPQVQPPAAKPAHRDGHADPWPSVVRVGLGPMASLRPNAEAKS